eukprot:626266-Amphidinium_carterae.1
MSLLVEGWTPLGLLLQAVQDRADPSAAAEAVHATHPTEADRRDLRTDLVTISGWKWLGTCFGALAAVWWTGCPDDHSEEMNEHDTTGPSRRPSNVMWYEY